MPINVTCQCGEQWVVEDSLAGKRILCSACKERVTVPGNPSPTDSEPTASTTSDLPDSLTTAPDDDQTDSIPEAGPRPGTPDRHSIREARRTLIAIGIFTIVFNSILLMLAHGNAERLIGNAGLKQPFNEVVQLIEQETIRLRLFNGIFASLGVLFVIFGFLVRLSPMPVTVAALVLYLIALAAFWFSGIIVDDVPFAFWLRALVSLGLIKAILAAVAYLRINRTAGSSTLSDRPAR